MIDSIISSEFQPSIEDNLELISDYLDIQANNREIMSLEMEFRNHGILDEDMEMNVLDLDPDIGYFFR